MISPVTPTLAPHTAPMTYATARTEFARQGVRGTDVPMEHSLSLPVPTRRWTRPGFAGFACPVNRVPRQPLRLGPPDRWWAIQAHRPRLLVYGLTAALPFADTAFETVTVDRGDRSLARLAEDLRQLDELMDRVVEPFLAGEPAAATEATLRADLLGVFTANVTEAVLPRYTALAPDFFTWLGDN
jgi:hypothetical protein